MDAAHRLLTICTDAKQDEVILFVTDDTSKEICEIMWRAAKDFPNRTAAMMSDRCIHGDEPPASIAAAMASADVIFGITKFSLFHTNARRNAAKSGARFANMADYSVDMFRRGGLFVDFVEQGILLDRLSDVLEGKDVHVTTRAGTDISFSAEGREVLRQYGRSTEPGTSSSPPDIEAALGPVGGTANGTVIIDGSIPHPDLGVLASPITLSLEKGKIVAINGGNEASRLKMILEGLRDESVYLIAEMGIGLNDRAQLRNRMLEDEGVMGTMHFGFGNSVSFGGSIDSRNHIDMIFKDPTLTVDGRLLMVDGELALE